MKKWIFVLMVTCMPFLVSAYCPVFSSSTGSGCRCNFGYQVNASGTGCERIKCGKNAHLVGDTCYCDTEYKINMSGAYCVPIECPDTINGYRSIVDEKCYCNDGYVWNEDKTRCSKDTSCPLHGYFDKDDEVCRCMEGYYINDGNTACNRIPKCPKNAFFSLDKKGCECEPGFRMGGDKRNCFKNDTVKNGYINAHTGKIDCYDGFHRVGGRCVPENKPNTVRAESSDDTSKKLRRWMRPVPKQEHIKTDNRYYKSDVNNRCEDGYMWYSALGRCIVLPAHAHVVDTLEEAWLCDPGYVEKNNQCYLTQTNTYQSSNQECPEGYIWYSAIGRCVYLPANAHAVDTPSDAWACNVGFYEKDNRCFPNEECPLQSQYMEEVGKCICSPKYVMLDQSCKTLRSITNVGIVYDYKFCKQANGDCEDQCAAGYYDLSDRTVYDLAMCRVACDYGGEECEEGKDQEENCQAFLDKCQLHCDAFYDTVGGQEYCRKACEVGYEDCDDSIVNWGWYRR